MKQFISYLTGCIALISVSLAIIATLHFLATNSKAASELASYLLRGVGSAMGAFLGGALILRFKAARTFIRTLIYEKDD